MRQSAVSETLNTEITKTKIVMSHKKEAKNLNVNETISKSEAFFDKYKKIIVIVLAAIVVLMAGYYVYHDYYAGPRTEKASTALAKGQQYFSMEQFEVALNGDKAGYIGFAKIASDYSGTDAANLANLYAGLCSANLGKWNDAVKYLESYDVASDAMVSPAAVAALANAYVQTGNVDKAVSKLKKAAEMADSKAADGVNISLSPTFLLQAGQLLESQGKKADAQKIYQDIKAKYLNATLVQSSEIDKYIERTAE